MQSSPESGGRAGYDEAKRRKGSKVHLAVDTLGHLLALLVMPANEQDRAQVKALVEQVQAATGEMVEVAFVDQGYTGAQPSGRPTVRTSGCHARAGRPAARDLGLTPSIVDRCTRARREDDSAER